MNPERDLKAVAPEEKSDLMKVKEPDSPVEKPNRHRIAVADLENLPADLQRYIVVRTELQREA